MSISRFRNDRNVRRYGFLFDDNFFSGQLYELTFYLEQTPPPSLIREKVKIILRSVNKDYYQYEKKLYKQQGSSGSTGIFGGEPVYIYDNVKNGYGVFGGFSRIVDSF